MTNEKRPPIGVLPGVISVAFRANVSLYEAAEVWTISDFKPVKDGFTYSTSFPPSIVRCVLSVPIGKELACAKEITSRFGTLTTEVKPIAKLTHPGGPFGC